jgi:hypothetical protein
MCKSKVFWVMEEGGGGGEGEGENQVLYLNSEV